MRFLFLLLVAGIAIYVARTFLGPNFLGPKFLGMNEKTRFMLIRPVHGGEISGVWTTSSRMAMKAFTDRVNASLPIDAPDYILLSLVQRHEGAQRDPLPPGDRERRGDHRRSGALAHGENPDRAGDGERGPGAPHSRPFAGWDEHADALAADDFEVEALADRAGEDMGGSE